MGKCLIWNVPRWLIGMFIVEKFSDGQPFTQRHKQPSSKLSRQWNPSTLNLSIDAGDSRRQTL